MDMITIMTIMTIRIVQITTIMSTTKSTSRLNVLKGLLYAALFIAASLDIVSFTSAKAYLRSLYGPDFSHTFYCNAPFNQKGVVLACPQGWSEEDCRLEWDHVVPASLLAANLPCSEKGTCSFNPQWSRRKCCQETSIEFSFREANIQNLVPSLRKVNREKSNFLPGVVQNHKRVKTLCDMKIDPKKKIFEPSNHRKGWVARIYLAMDKHYGLPLSSTQRQLLVDWDCRFPITEEEKRHNELLNLSR